MRLRDKVVLIAGAGGRQGTTVPVLFAREGAKVMLAGLDPAEIERVVAHIEQEGGAAAGRAADLTVAAEAEAAVRQTIERFGRIDVLYNNTGIYLGGEQRAGETPEGDWDRLLAVDVKTHFLAAHYSLREMARQQSGCVINVAAARAARLGGNVAYAAAKSAIIGMTRKMAAEYARDNVRVNCICPTNIQASAEPLDPRPPALRVERDGTPEDVAYAALFLASDEAAWITGIELVVDGGAEVMG
ncbi:MAG TPA: SDR family oxidoreductase [Dehalococcoidia bacterium]|nr:SDR family oxidoreductase [Dehalococcoidia bacterium]